MGVRTKDNAPKANAYVAAAGGILAGWGFASVVQNSTGDYTATFNGAMPDVNYSTQITMDFANTFGAGTSAPCIGVYNKTVNGFSYRLGGYTGTTNTNSGVSVNHSLSASR